MTSTQYYRSWHQGVWSKVPEVDRLQRHRFVPPHSGGWATNSPWLLGDKKTVVARGEREKATQNLFTASTGMPKWLLRERTKTHIRAPNGHDSEVYCSTLNHHQNPKFSINSGRELPYLSPFSNSMNRTLDSQKASLKHMYVHQQRRRNEVTGNLYDDH